MLVHGVPRFELWRPCLGVRYLFVCCYIDIVFLKYGRTALVSRHSSDVISLDTHSVAHLSSQCSQPMKPQVLQTVKRHPYGVAGSPP